MSVRGSAALLLLAFALTTFANPIAHHGTPSTTLKYLDDTPSIDKRDDPKPSDYPWAGSGDDALIKNEFKWLGWDKNNKDDERDGKKIHKAFREWHEFAKAGQKAAGQNKAPRGTIYKRWFGDDDQSGDIGDVFAGMIDPKTGEATKNIANMVNRRDDFDPRPENRCDKKPNMNAYTQPATGEFHFCPHGLEQKQNSELTCGTFDAYVSSKMRSISMTFLHETTHYGSVADIGLSIIDKAKGAYDCFKLSADDKVENAQNYAWLAADAYWGEKCNKVYIDPAEGTREVEDSPSPPPKPSPKPAPPATPPPAPKLTRALDIVADVGELNFRKKNDPTMTWQFITTDYGKKIDCRKDSVYSEGRKEDTNKSPTFPGGTFNLKLYGEDCQYKNNGSNEGRLFCPGKEIPCMIDPAYKAGLSIWRNVDGGNYMCEGNVKRQPMYTCAW